MSNKIETIPYFKKAFLQTSVRISRQNQKYMKHIEFPKKCQNHWTLAYKYQKKNLIKLSEHSVYLHIVV
jgi:hypothetical protein